MTDSIRGRFKKLRQNNFLVFWSFPIWENLPVFVQIFRPVLKFLLDNDPPQFHQIRQP